MGGNGYYYFYDWNYSFPVDFCSSSRVSLPIEVVLPLNLPDTLKNCNAVSIQSPANLGTYRWNNGATTNNITTLNSGLYTLTITGSNCTATDSVRVIIPERLRLPAGNPLCGRTLSSNYANSSSTYNWSNGRTTATITITATGTYRLTVNEPSGCVLIDSLQVTRFGTVPTITLPGTPAYCNQAVLNAQNSGAQYLWSNGTTTQTATFASAGTARVTVTNTDQCTATSQASFTLDAQPQAAFNIQPIAGNPLRYQFVNSSTGNTANQWDFGFITSQAQSPTVNFPATGRYVVSLVVTNSCGSSTLTNSVDLPLANEYTLNSEFNLRPNPNNGIFLIELPESLNTEIIIVNLYNLYGQQLHQQKWQANNRKQLDMQTVLSSGIYYIKITDDGGNQVWYTRFVVD